MGVDSGDIVDDVLLLPLLHCVAVGLRSLCLPVHYPALRCQGFQILQPVREQVGSHPGHDPVEIFRRARSACVRASRLKDMWPMRIPVQQQQQKHITEGMRVEHWLIYCCKNNYSRSKIPGQVPISSPAVRPNDIQDPRSEIRYNPTQEIIPKIQNPKSKSQCAPEARVPCERLAPVAYFKTVVVPINASRLDSVSSNPTGVTKIILFFENDSRIGCRESA